MESPETVKLITQYRKSYTEDRQKRIWDSLFYSHQRLDILIITISSAGIYLCFETIKFQIQKGLVIEPIIKTAAISLLIAIMLNLITQWLSSKIHEYDYLIAEYCNDTDNDEKADCDEYIRVKEISIERTESWHKIATILSRVTMFLGLSSLVYYYCFIFS